MAYLRELAAALLPDDNQGKKEIGVIISNHPGDVQACFMDLINVWTQQKPATWKEFIDALNVTEQPELAKTIGRLLTPPYPQGNQQQGPKNSWGNAYTDTI